MHSNRSRRNLNPIDPPPGEDTLPDPGLLSRHFGLRPLIPADLPRLYEMSMSPLTIHTWRFAGVPPTYDEFVKSLDQGVHFQLVVTKRLSSDALGLVTLYNANARHEFAYLAAVMDPTLIASGHGIEPLFVFIYYCFSVWPFKKIYFEALDRNWDRFSSGLTRDLFVEEGRLRGHAYIMGRRADYYIGAIYPEIIALNPFFRRLLKLYLVKDTRPSLVPNTMATQRFPQNLQIPLPPQR